MEVSYKKDLRNNYLVIHEEVNKNEEDYCLKMIKANSIPGIIKPDIRIIDNKIFYYFDITSKQSLAIIYEKAPINYVKLKKIFLNVVEIMDQVYEYLLNENDLVLEPEYMYEDLSAGKIHMCYLPRYNIDIRKQLINLIEYLMNKVDYKDNEAVLYIYNLYAICREDGFSYEKFLLQIKESRDDGPVKPPDKISRGSGITKPEVNIHGEDVNIHQCKINLPDGNVGEPEEMPENANLLKKIPVMDEKITDDREIFYYPLKTYLYTGICCLGAVLIFVMSFYTKLVYNSLGNRIDYGKLTVLILMVFVAAGYLISKIWDKKNRLTKVVRKVEYIDPRKYPENQDIGIINENTSACTSFQNTYSSKSIGLKNANEAAGAINPTVLLNFKDENNNPTVLLNADKPTSGCRLEPKENDKYDVIRMTEFPFIIGKQKGNVDYFLDMDVVSRYHVKITREEDKYYITDLNSTNGTCLNKKPLSCYQRYELKEGDEVTIAGIVYMFRETA